MYEICVLCGSPQLLHGGTKMVRIADGCDIPNLSDIVEETFDSVCIFGNYDDDTDDVNESVEEV